MTQVIDSPDDPKKGQELRDAWDQPNPRGHPPKLIPDEQTLATIRGLASLCPTYAEAASVFHVHERTFSKFLASYTAAREAWDEGYNNGRLTLRRYQFREATNGDTTMLIWLGKNLLGQSDKRELTHRNAAITPIDPAGSQQDAAERYAETMNLPPALRLIATPIIEGEAEEVPTEAEASLEDEQS